MREVAYEKLSRESLLTLVQALSKKVKQDRIAIRRIVTLSAVAGASSAVLGFVSGLLVGWYF